MNRLGLYSGIVTAALHALPALARENGITGIEWGRNSKDFAGMPSGPQPLKNINRDAKGVADDHALVGDFRNPILTPYAAGIVRRKGEQALAGGIRQFAGSVPPGRTALHLRHAVRFPNSTEERRRPHLRLSRQQRVSHRSHERHAFGEGGAFADGQFDRPLGRGHSGHRYGWRAGR